MSSSQRSPNRASWFATWMIETVSLIEERWGPYEDRREMAQPFTGTAREQLQQRNLALAERTGLSQIAHRGITVARWGVAGLVLLALLLGAGTAQAVLGTGATPVNLFWALSGLLAPPLLTLLLWLLTLALPPGVRGIPAILLLRLSQWATRKLNVTLPSQANKPAHISSTGTTADSAPQQLAPAMVGLLRRAGLLQPLSGLASHLWWSIALLSSLVTLGVLLATRRYGFVWETTLLDPALFKSLTAILSTVPAWLGFTLPEPDVVARTVTGASLSAAEQALWSRWLLGCVISYGLLPRLLLGALCALWAWHNRQRLMPNWQSPGLAVQEARLAGRSSTPQVLDPAPATLPTSPVSLPKASSSAPPAWQAPRQIVGLELGTDIAWPPLDTSEAVSSTVVDPAQTLLTKQEPWHDSGRFDSLPDINRLLAAYSHQPPEELILVLDARRTPDRGLGWTLERFQQLVPQARLHFLPHTADQQRLDQWLQFLQNQAIHLRPEPPISARESS